VTGITLHTTKVNYLKRQCEYPRPQQGRRQQLGTV